MNKCSFLYRITVGVMLCFPLATNAQVVITQYYEGGGTNKWIELTNLGSSSVNTASPQLKLALWAVAGSTGNINFSGAATNTYNLTVTIPAKGSVLIGNTGNGTEVPYLTAGSANETTNSVINFNGNDGVALLDASSNVIDRFGQGINAADVSYVRSTGITGPNATFTPAEWTSTSLATVQAASVGTNARLGYQLPPLCTAPANSATALVFSSVTSTSMNVGFTAAGSVDGYLVVRHTDSSLSANPVDATSYVPGNTIGGGTVVSAGTATSFSQTGLSPSTTYYFFVFSYNDLSCSLAPAYKSTALTGSRVTDDAVLNHYFGNLHSHSKYSDGNDDDTTKTPADNYEFAKTAMCMDFLGISEHNHAGAGMQLAHWQPGRTQAAAATTSSFVALHGQEWGVIGTTGVNGDHAGHVLVYGMDSLIGWEAGNYQINVAKSTYTGTGGLFDIINRHGNNAFASLAHPNNYDYDNLLNIAYDALADDAIAATAIESGPAFSTDTTYSNPASIGYFAFYKNMLAKGYHLGPTIDHDNHNLTFGKTAKTRLAVMATSLSEANLLDAMRKMRFYATEDCAAKINFTINLEPMGSIITRAGAPNILVTSITTNSVTSLKLMYGVPGSGSSPTTLTSVSTGSLTYTHNALANLATGYYFLDITESDGTRVITSPIWYTRDNSASRPLFVTSFFTVNERDKVILKWTAANEPLNESYEIQRSVNGRTFTTIGNANGKGAGAATVHYSIEDLQPVNGLAYYRLVHKSAYGTIRYSELKEINRSAIAVPYFVAYPNPVQNMLSVKIVSTQAERARIEVLDMSGRILKTLSLNLSQGEQNIQLNLANLARGSYVVKMQLNNAVQTQMLNKL